ncbi:hypothetical protein G6F22_021199 [Rhizopus arrhizus]|nr:hypothetical protein G6F22_021199 [Rhizopus arrhizus]
MSIPAWKRPKATPSRSCVRCSAYWTRSAWRWRAAPTRSPNGRARTGSAAFAGRRPNASRTSSACVARPVASRPIRAFRPP